MRASLATLAFILAISVAVLDSAQVANTQQPWIKIAISTSQSVVKSGSAVVIKITKTNTTDHNLFYGVGVGSFTDLDVRNSEGKFVPETPYGQKIHDKGHWSGGSVFSVPLEPGKARKEEVELSKEYDLSRPGEYTIQARETDPQGIVVKSNTITVTVTP